MIEVSYNHEKKRLRIFKDGKFIGGCFGKRATEYANKIASGKAKIVAK